MASPKDVLVVGCGPAGIGQLVGFAQADVKHNVVCFEQGSEIGGLWTYSEKTGDVHQSM